MAARAANLRQNLAFRLQYESGLRVRQKCSTNPLFEWSPLFLLFLQEIISCRRRGEGKNSGIRVGTRRLVRFVGKNEKVWGCMLGATGSDQEAR
jgi:hypothetical protein